MLENISEIDYYDDRVASELGNSSFKTLISNNKDCKRIIQYVANSPLITTNDSKPINDSYKNHILNKGYFSNFNYSYNYFLYKQKYGNFLGRFDLIRIMKKEYKNHKIWSYIDNNLNNNLNVNEIEYKLEDYDDFSKKYWTKCTLIDNNYDNIPLKL